MAPTTLPLFGESLRAAARPWLFVLGPSDRERLEGLLCLAVREQLRLSDCLATLFPGMESREAQTAFTSFLKRLNDAAQGKGLDALGLRFHVDSNEQRPPDERFCWFTGPAPALMQAERDSEQLLGDIQGSSSVRTKGLATPESASAPGGPAASGTLAIDTRLDALFSPKPQSPSAPRGPDRFDDWVAMPDPTPGLLMVSTKRVFLDRSPGVP